MDMVFYQRNPQSLEYAVAKCSVMKVLFSTLLLAVVVVVVVVGVVVVVVPTYCASHTYHHQYIR
jgi:uncharacterized membrane protein